MILRIALGEHVEVCFDDELTDSPPSPELVEDYLTRMSRTAFTLWDRTTDSVAPVVSTEDES